MRRCYDRFMLLALTTMILPTALLATLRNVPEEYLAIQSAIDSSSSGDTILVQPGSYTEIVNYNGKNVTVGSLFLTTGDTAYVDSTIIDGGANGQSPVKFRNNEDSTAVLTGFTIRNGETDFGGGIYIRAASPTISRCVVENCHATRGGGGIYCTTTAGAATQPHISDVLIRGNVSDNIGGGFGCYIDTHPVLERIAVTNNSASIAGGIYCSGGRLDITDAIIADDSTVGNGGGIYSVNQLDLNLQNCVISGNQAGSGGGLYMSGAGTAELERVIIIGNIVSGSAGAMSLSGTEMTLTNSTIEDNTANSAGGIYAGAAIILHLVNSIIYNYGDYAIYAAGNGNNIEVSYTDIRGGQDGVEMADPNELHWGDGNLAGDPRYRDPENGDYRLGWGSPCIDAGNPDSPLDPDSSRADMGALVYYRFPTLLYGQVTAAASGNPIEGAQVSTDYGVTLFTDAEGRWQIGDALADAPFSIGATYAGYIPQKQDGLEIGPDDTLEINFALNRPLFGPSAEKVTMELPRDSSATTHLTIENQGDWPLQWSAERRVRGVNVAPWQRMVSFNLSATLNSYRLNGVAFVKDRFYVAYVSPETTEVAVLDREGALVTHFQQFGRTQSGMADLDWDGELLWGSGEKMIYGFTREGELKKSWQGAYNSTTAIAWDAANGMLWTASVVGRWISGFDRDGRSVRNLDQEELAVRGLAYWPDDPDGYPLYILHSPDLDHRAITKMNPVNGDTLPVTQIAPPEGGIMRSAFITDEYRLSTTVFMGIIDDANGDRLEIYLVNSDPKWLEFSPGSGEVAAGNSEDMRLDFSSADLDSGTYEAELAFNFPEIADSAKIPVTMTVVPPNGIVDFGLRILDFGLGEAYPNPFNSQTVASYKLQVASRVSLALYDIGGRLVQTLVDEQQTAGEHRAMVNGESLASGVYLLKLTAGKEAAVRKVVCVK